MFAAYRELEPGVPVWGQYDPRGSRPDFRLDDVTVDA